MLGVRVQLPRPLEERPMRTARAARRDYRDPAPKSEEDRYYEDFDLPEEERYARVSRWREACLSHPAAQQVTREEIVEVYYDYAKGAGNGALPPERSRSSFVFDPGWNNRPWPPKDNYGHAATDQELGFLG
jgi:glutathione S-transferase